MRRVLAPFTMSQVQQQPENDAGICDSGIGSMHGEEGSRRTPKSLGKIMNKIDDLELRLCEISSTDSRSWELPYKPQVAPPQCRGGGSQNRGGLRNSGPDQACRGGRKRGNSERNGNDNRSQNSFRGSGNRSFGSEQNM